MIVDLLENGYTASKIQKNTVTQQWYIVGGKNLKTKVNHVLQAMGRFDIQNLRKVQGKANEK